MHFMHMCIHLYANNFVCVRARVCVFHTQGLGTDETTLIEIMCTRSNAQIAVRIRVYLFLFVFC